MYLKWCETVWKWFSHTINGKKYSDICPQTLNFFKCSPRVLPTSFIFIFICGKTLILELIMKRNYINAFFYACQTFRKNYGTFEIVRQSMITRVHACLGSGVGHYGHSSRTALPLKMWPIGFPETWVTNYQFTLRNIPEERVSYLHRGRSLKSRICCW